MAHITLSIPDTVYKEMKRHPEIKWSEIARQSIIEKNRLLKKSMHSKELFKLLPTETQEEIKKTGDKEWAEFYQKGKKKVWKRAKYLTRA